MNKANMIRLNANKGAAEALADFLKAGGELVAQTEPRTRRWYALMREDAPSEQAIFDVFPDQAGRQAHFDGQVAAALADNAPRLVQGGWDGVLSNVTNLVTLAAHEADGDVEITKATYIGLVAKPGKAAELEAFLTAGRDAVAETEPNTRYWVALKSEDRLGHFAIFDLFESEEGRAEHFAGAVASALADRAGDLVAGGWDDGVLANVRNFDVRAVVRRDA